MKIKTVLALTTLPLALATVGAANASNPSYPARPQATLHNTTLSLRGGSFTPSAVVRVAVFNTTSWREIASRRFKTEPAIYPCVSASVYCGQRDPAAGRLDASMTIRASKAAQLGVLFRSGASVSYLAVERR